MRTPFIAGNWKMHGSLAQVKTLTKGIVSACQAYSTIDISLCPSFVHLHEVQQNLAGSFIQLGAQNLYVGTQGAFTGEVSGSMLKELGCRFVLVGHSERRTIFHEDVNLVAQKFKAAIEAGLIPILCVGETKEQRESDQTEKVIEAQIESVISIAGIASFAHAVIAYEPVWAIGTGLTATPDQAEAVHAFIRQLITQKKVDLAPKIRILYGGSMKPDNAKALLSQPNIDGGLIGGASLDATQFASICETAASLSSQRVSRTG